MKKFIFILLTLLFISSCDNSKNSESVSENSFDMQESSINEIEDQSNNFIESQSSDDSLYISSESSQNEETSSNHANFPWI